MSASTAPSTALIAEHDAVLYCGGSETPRDAGIPGVEFAGVHDAMPYLVQQNRRVGRENIDSVGWPSDPILAGGKHIVVVGGGDTASDCVGTAFRQGAVKVTQLDIRPQPPEKEDKLAVWPFWATKMRTSSSQAEGAVREFQVATLEFVGEDGVLTGVKCCQVDERRKPIAGTEFVIKADLAFIAIGFSGPCTDSVLKDMGDKLAINTDKRGSHQCHRQRQGLPDLGRQALGRRRRAPRPVAGRLGDPRRPPGGACDRRGADGLDGPAALIGYRLRRSKTKSKRRVPGWCAAFSLCRKVLPPVLGLTYGGSIRCNINLVQ